MKSFIFVFMFMTTPIIFAGPEVPWPEVIERGVFVKDLQGMWVSKNLSPQRAFEIKLQATNYDLACPYLITITELSPFTGRPLGKDIDILCSSFSRKLFFVLNDEFGKNQRVVEMIGIFKAKDASELGDQYLGITVYDHNESKEISYQDIFYKLSR